MIKYEPKHGTNVEDGKWNLLVTLRKGGSLKNYNQGLDGARLEVKKIDDAFEVFSISS